MTIKQKYDTVLDIIGNTPLVRLQRINPNPKVTIDNLNKAEVEKPGKPVKPVKQEKL